MRRVLLQVLWTWAALPFEGERFFAALMEHSWTFVHAAYGSPRPGVDPTAALAEMLEVLDITRAASERLKTAKIGDTVEFPLRRTEFVKHVADSVSWMRQGPFDSLSPDEQDDVLDCHAAARSLLDEFARDGR